MLDPNLGEVALLGDAIAPNLRSQQTIGGALRLRFPVSGAGAERPR